MASKNKPSNEDIHNFDMSLAELIDFCAYCHKDKPEQVYWLNAQDGEGDFSAHWSCFMKRNKELFQ